MIILPKVRGFMCTTAHPVGCAHNVQRQIDHVRACRPLESGPQRVLVIGSSTGYGLASRIAAAYGGGAATVGVFMEKPGSERRCGSAGWYNAAALRRSLSAAGLYARDFNGDAFSTEMKQQLVAVLAEELGPVDLVIYSLASPRRTHPVTGTLHKSVLKPIGGPITARTIDTDRRQIVEQTLEAADEDEIADTVAVMGGDDWQLWIAALAEAGLLARGCRTLAYTYIGDRITWPIYGQATIGAAKKDLDRAAQELRLQLADLDGDARVAVLKAVVTQASSAIPIMPLYLSLLFKVMKSRGVHEGCIEQIEGLMQQLYGNAKPLLDDCGRYRRDGAELAPEVQREVAEAWDQVTTENLEQSTDYLGYQRAFLQLFGFEMPGVDYSADAEQIVDVPGIVA